jgi:hypothetical protein
MKTKSSGISLHIDQQIDTTFGPSSIARDRRFQDALDLPPNFCFGWAKGFSSMELAH